MLKKAISLKVTILIFIYLIFIILLANGPKLHDLSWQTNNKILIYSSEILAITYFIINAILMFIVFLISSSFAIKSDNLVCLKQSECLITTPNLAFSIIFLVGAFLIIKFVINNDQQKLNLK